MKMGFGSKYFWTWVLNDSTNTKFLELGQKSLVKVYRAKFTDWKSANYTKPKEYNNCNIFQSNIVIMEERYVVFPVQVQNLPK